MLRSLIVSGLVGVLIIACSKDSKNTMLVQGEIQNLKKGTLYLKKIKDTLFVSVDSVQLDGQNTFSLSDQIESPELYFLNLDNIANKEISFFGDVGTITINTKLDKFQSAATIKGLRNQELLDEYNKMKSQFSDKRLDYIKADFDAKKSGDTAFIDSIQGQIQNLLKRRYYYTTNFAIVHSDQEIAPYLALSELYDANISLLDTINKSLSQKVKDGKYGKALAKFIEEIKTQK